MGSYTRNTRRWLEGRYRQTTADGVYYAHQPIYGRRHPGYSEPGDIWRRARQFQSLRTLNRLEFDTFLDVGGSEGLTSHHVQSLFGAKVVTADLSAAACRRAWDLFGVDGVACDSVRLPFADGAFDVVLCSEMIEHVEFPCEVLLELRRIARRALIVTTDECKLDRTLVDAHRPSLIPHAERNVFHPDDFVTLLGSQVQLAAQFKGAPPPEDVDDARAAAWIRSSLDDPTLEDGVGISVTLVIDAAARRGVKLPEDEIIAALLRPQAPLRPTLPRELPVDRMIHGVVCPTCRSALASQRTAFRCEGCDRTFPFEDGVPSFFLDFAPNPTADDLQRQLQRLWPNDQRRRDAALSIRRRLEAVVPPLELRWDFGDASARARWEVGAQFTVQGQSTDGLQLLSTGTDPWLTSPLLVFPPTGVSAVEIEMAFTSASGPDDVAQGQIYFATSAYPGFSDERSIRFPVPGDGRMHRHRLAVVAPPLGSEPELILLRLDLVDRPGTVLLKSFEVERAP